MITLSKELPREKAEWLDQFLSIRHMTWDVNKIKKRGNGIFGTGKVDPSGMFFFPQGYEYKFKPDDRILDTNEPAGEIPTLYSPVKFAEEYVDGGFRTDFSSLVIDSDELGTDSQYLKDWFNFLIKYFFEPEGILLNGEESFYGEEDDDFGTVTIVDNKVTTNYGYNLYSLSQISDKELREEVNRRPVEITNGDGETTTYNVTEVFNMLKGSVKKTVDTEEWLDVISIALGIKEA